MDKKFVKRKRGKSKLSLTKIQRYISYVFKAMLHGRRQRSANG